MSYQICSYCVLDSKEVPDIVFDEFGVCNYCLRVQSGNREREAEKTNLQWVLHDMRTDGEYDVLLGLSGGVDSSMCLHYLLENGIRPLCFSVDNGWNTKEADENIMRLVEGLKVPFFRYVLDIERFKDLQSAFLKAGVKNIEIPTDHVLMAASYEMARKHGIKTIVSGGNWQTESIMPDAYGYQARDLKHIKGIYKLMTGKKLTGLPMMSLPGYLYNRFVKGIRTVNLLDYYDYNREKAIQLLSEKYGYKPYGEKHCENVFTWWHINWYLPEKFGLDKNKPHYASLINSGQMTRQEAMVKLRGRREYPVLGFEKRVMEYPRKEWYEYPNNKKLWDFLSKCYGLHQKRR